MQFIRNGLPRDLCVFSTDALLTSTVRLAYTICFIDDTAVTLKENYNTF